MSTIYYCDVCGHKMKLSDFQELRVKLGYFSAQVMTAHKNVWNAGHICHACVKKLVAKGKP